MEAEIQRKLHTLKSLQESRMKREREVDQQIDKLSKKLSQELKLKQRIAEEERGEERKARESDVAVIKAQNEAYIKETKEEDFALDRAHRAEIDALKSEEKDLKKQLFDLDYRLEELELKEAESLQREVEEGERELMASTSKYEEELRKYEDELDQLSNVHEQFTKKLFGSLKSKTVNGELTSGIVELEVATNDIKDALEQIIIRSNVFNKKRAVNTGNADSAAITKIGTILLGELRQAKKMLKTLRHTIVEFKKKCMACNTEQGKTLVECLAKLAEKLSRVGDAMAHMESDIETDASVDPQPLLKAFAKLETEVCNLSLRDGAPMPYQQDFQQHYHEGRVEEVDHDSDVDSVVVL
ncbi:unnamed protein product [Caenorhabditis auriculariae]|uniref:Uncharacterized protein n=1 Tax=Caenorhabditis auriculariae TaxID=2777116 RepID=A0A8S1HRA6_9PELO|nr:unnamed protein product [Caenorhabditis auriculariae]